jgi:hypothetical protein
MNKAIRFVGSVAVMLGCAAAAMGQAGAPTQRVHIPGIPDGTSIYPKSPEVLKDNVVSIGCITKSDGGEYRVVDWRGAAETSVAGAPSAAARPPMVLRLQGDPEMLNFQVGHEVQVSGPIVEVGDASHPPEIKVAALLYLSRTCWARGTTTPAPANQKPQ